MISSNLKTRIDKYFPDIGFAQFQKRFDIPEYNIERLSMEEAEYMNKRSINIANDLAMEMATYEEEARQKEKAVDNEMDQILYTINKGGEYAYKDYTNFKDDKNQLSNEASRKSYASFIVHQKIVDGVLANPDPDRSRANILKSLWFSMMEIGRRIDAASASEATRLKYSARNN